jgi:cell wall-associated NlpC family hydrolase
MKKTSLGAIAGIFSMSILPVCAHASVSPQYVETVHGWVSYHSAPRLSAPVTGRLTLDEKAPLVQVANQWWYEITVDGKDVYITTNTNYTKAVNQPTAPTPTPVPAPIPTPAPAPAPTPAPIPTWQSQADRVITTAKTQLGVTYLWGKQEPGIGFDCSNFVAWSYNKALGIHFSGASEYQRQNVGTPVALGQIRAGDLLFFATAHNATGGGHVGLYMGNGMVIQEGGGWGKVTIEPLNGTWLGRNLVFARRIIR